MNKEEQKKENKRQVKNMMVFVTLVALTLGTIAGFANNLFQGCVIVIAALVFIAFIIMKHIFPKIDEEVEEE